MMIENNLSARVESVRAERFPNRSLEFKLRLRNHRDCPLALYRSMVRCRMAGRVVARGDYLSTPAALITPTTESDPETSATVSVPMRREALAYIEDRRTGGDLEFHLSIKAYVASLPGEGDGSQWTRAQQIQITDHAGNQFYEGEIPQSRWIELLSNLRWKEVRLVEVPATVNTHRYPDALRRWQDARDHFAAGRWEETIQTCNLVTERLAAAKRPLESGDLESHEVDASWLREFFPNGAKGETLNDLLKEFRGFLQFGRHEVRRRREGETDRPRVSKADAELALMVTREWLRYLSVSQSNR